MPVYNKDSGVAARPRRITFRRPALPTRAPPAARSALLSVPPKLTSLAGNRPNKSTGQRRKASPVSPGLRRAFGRTAGQDPKKTAVEVGLQAASLVPVGGVAARLGVAAGEKAVPAAVRVASKVSPWVRRALANNLPTKELPRGPRSEGIAKLDRRVVMPAAAVAAGRGMQSAVANVRAREAAAARAKRTVAARRHRARQRT